MNRSSKVQYFDSEGRENLPAVIKCIRSFLKSQESQGGQTPNKVVFLTVQGEGPMLAYNQLKSEDLQIIAVTFPNGAAERIEDGKLYRPEMSARVRDFFNGVKIPIVTGRLPFDEVLGADAHNREMKLIRNTLGLFGSSMALVIQAVLQAADAGHLEIGEQVIAASGDTALLATATTTRNFLRQDHFGLAINEVLCKPRAFTMSRKEPRHLKALTLEGQRSIEAPTAKAEG